MSSTTSLLFPLTKTPLSTSKRPIYTKDEIECLIFSREHLEVYLPEKGGLAAVLVVSEESQQQSGTAPHHHSTSLKSPTISISDHELRVFFSQCHEVRLSTHRIIFMTPQEAFHVELKLVSEKYERKKSGLFNSARVIMYFNGCDPNCVHLKLKFKSNKYMDQFADVLDRQFKEKAWEKAEKDEERRDFGLGLAGVGGLQRMREENASKEQDSMQVAFKDLDSLMKSARDMVELARRFSTELNKRESEMNQSDLDKEVKEFNNMLMGMGMTESVVSKQMSGNMFYVELARQLTDFLKQPLERSQGLITLIDAYCLYNRARGTDLISPEDMLKASSLLEELKLPMRMQTFDSGVIVLTNKLDPTQDLMEQLKPYLVDDIGSPMGMTAVQTAHVLHISVALAESRLEQAEKESFLCRDEASQGVSFFANLFFSSKWECDYESGLDTR